MIRKATQHDIPALVELSAQMHVESDFRDVPFDPEMTTSFFEVIVDGENCTVFVSENKEGELTGMIGGILNPFQFSLLRKANDLGFYVVPEERKGRAAIKLEEAYRNWAFSFEDVVRVYLGITTGFDKIGELYERLGYTCVGGLYRISKEK